MNGRSFTLLPAGRATEPKPSERSSWHSQTISEACRSVTRSEAVNVLDQLIRADTPAIAGRTLAYARACHGWAEKRGKVPGSPIHRPSIPRQWRPARGT